MVSEVELGRMVEEADVAPLWPLIEVGGEVCDGDKADEEDGDEPAKWVDPFDGEKKQTEYEIDGRLGDDGVAETGGRDADDAWCKSG